MAARDERRSATVAVSSDRSLDWKLFVLQVVANILSKGMKLRDYTKGVENNLWQVELESIQDYIEESDNLLLLHDQIHDCDSILSQMETLLSGFQAEIGSISSDIKVRQEKSMDMGLKLKNRKVAESKLAKFVEDSIVPPRMIDIIVDGEGQKDKNGTRTQLGLSDRNRRKNVSLCREGGFHAWIHI